MTLSTVAATGLQTRCRLELEARQFHHEHVGPARLPARSWHSTSSTGSPMLPTHVANRPAARKSSAVSAVTVVLPLEPVIASTFCPGGNARANSSTSPTSSAPRATRGPDRRLVLGEPGADDDRLRRRRASRRRWVRWSTGTCGNSARSCAAQGGSARVSATATRAPWRAAQRAADKPVMPSPSTTTRRSLSVIVSAASGSTGRTAPAAW